VYLQLLDPLHLATASVLAKQRRVKYIILPRTEPTRSSYKGAFLPGSWVYEHERATDAPAFNLSPSHQSHWTRLHLLQKRFLGWKPWEIPIYDPSVTGSEGSSFTSRLNKIGLGFWWLQILLITSFAAALWLSKSLGIYVSERDFRPSRCVSFDVMLSAHAR